MVKVIDYFTKAMRDFPTMLVHFYRLLKHALGMLRQNPSVLLVFFFVIVYNGLQHWLLSVHDNVQVLDLGAWAFESLPILVSEIFSDPIYLLLVLLALLAQAFFGVWVSQELMLIYQHQRRSVLDSLEHLRVAPFIWLFLAIVIVHLVFGAFGLALYAPAYALWHLRHMNFLPVLVFGFVVLYPLFYISLSVSATFSVLPFSTRERIKKMKYLASGKKIRALYFFYAARLAIEGVLVLVLPYMSLILFQNEALASISLTIGLLVPFALLRGSSYELKLELLISDPDINALFAKHFCHVDVEEANRIT